MLTKRCHLLEILDACLDIFFLRLFAEVKHMAGEKSFAMLIEVLLVFGEHTIEPGQQFMRTVV
jgi:hypothetical protein